MEKKYYVVKHRHYDCEAVGLSEKEKDPKELLIRNKDLLIEVVPFEKCEIIEKDTPPTTFVPFEFISDFFKRGR